MPEAEEFKQRRPVFTMNLSGHYGSGKTLQAHSFPKCYTISIDPAGLETLRQPVNQPYMDNLVWFEELNTEKDIELKTLFNEHAKSTERQSLYGCLAHAKELAAEGKIQTLIIDGFTYLCDLKWHQITRYEEVKSERTGGVDTQAMYRALGLALYRMTAVDILTLASRHKLSVIFTTHLKRESDEAIHGSDKIKNRARKVNLLSDIAPQIEGGFRNKFEGLVGASLYLEKKIKDEKLQYHAICDMAPGMSTIVMAKNRFGLPPRIDLTNKSLYKAVMGALKLKDEAAAQSVQQTAGTQALKPAATQPIGQTQAVKK
jgi:hypothetical protein